MKSEPIWHPVVSSTSPWVYLRKSFILSSASRKAWMQCACNGPFEIYLNGRRVGRGLGPALTQVPVWNTCTISDLVQPGENVLLVLARAHPDPGEPSWFRAEGQIFCADDSEMVLCSGDSWQVLRADAWQVRETEPLAEVYSAASTAWREGRLQEEGFEAAVASKARIAAPLVWSPRPAIEEEVWAREVVRFGEIEATGPLRFEAEPRRMEQCKCVHREALLQPGKTRTLVQTRNPQRAVYLVLDFGRVVTGFPRLRLRGGGAGVLDMGFARTWGEIESGLRYVCAAGLQEWSGIQMKSCRYLVVRLSQCGEALEVDCVSLLERRVAVEEGGSFAATESLEKIWKTGERTLEACRQEVYWFAGPQQPFDWLRAYALALDDYYLSGDGRTAAATLAANPPPRSGGAAVPQALAYVLFVEAFQGYHGQDAAVAEVLPGALQVLDACAEHRTAEGLLPAVGAWCSTALNALYAGALDAAGRLCSGAGENEQGALYERTQHQVRQALQTAWVPQQGLFSDRPAATQPLSQWSNGLVLYFGLADEGQQEQMVHQLRGAHLRRVEDLLEAFFVAGGLWRTGLQKRALDFLRQQWGRLLARKGRTWAEKNPSQAPAMPPGPEYYLGSQVLGIRPGAPGYEVVEIRPQSAALSRARGRILTPRGAVEVEWDSRVSFSMRVVRTEEGETHLWVPRLGKRFPILNLNGETVWRNEKFHPNSFVQEIASTEEWTVLVLRGAGPYEVRVE